MNGKKSLIHIAVPGFDLKWIYIQKLFVRTGMHVSLWIAETIFEHWQVAELQPANSMRVL